MCVKMAHMKTASVRDVQHNLSEVLSWVERGEEVLVYRRKRLVARLVPPTPAAVESPDFIARARAIWDERAIDTPLSRLVDEARGDR